ncbi:hypothetical protein [Mycolicibacterium mageritense]|uniref:hypothetical protein n=1 Tax=Mycolicibacterium mageritense TaxID=53462 RepID=UPI0011D94513|nr:hypothetical protein [Mycolicibacterium mageritense]TXI56468.1 MAG: hypothetical protein E6Q55_28800 [Mycolicibacterium mageritense]
MSHTYRLAAQLQAIAIDHVDHNTFGTHRIPSPQCGITTLARHRATGGRRTVTIIARDHDDRLLAAADATTPLDGGPIDSHITKFRSAHLVWTRAITPPAHWWSRDPSVVTTAPRNRIAFTAIGHTQYYLNHDWLPGRDPRATHWTLSTFTATRGLEPALTDIDIDTALHRATALDAHAHSVA